MTRRVNKWQTALQAVFVERERRPFEWGTQDCCLFAADCVLAVTGEDPMKDLRGTYGGESSAAKVLEDAGGVAAGAAARLGVEVTVPEAQLGDVVLVVMDGRETLTICAGGSMVVGPGPDGLTHLPISMGLRAWRCVKDD